MEKGDRLPDDEWLWRRVFINQIKPDGSVSPRAFSPRPKDEGFLSVDMERLTTFESRILDVSRFSIFRFEAVVPHTFPKINCTYDPVEGNDAHALVGRIESDDEIVAATLALHAAPVFPQK